ncbi:hypothetical protein JXL21_09255 [Candidatus Bathyarchaeota archaeon]|nr:hypothetical protein [Candidatus Bathyarchaeota archaeon]
MSDEYILRWFREDDVSAYVDGLNKALYDEYSEEVFDWKVRHAPFNVGFTPIAVAEHVSTGVPVAFNSFMPLETRIGDETVMTLQGFDGFVDEKHRRRGLFQRTIRFMAEEMEGRSPEFLMSFNLVEAAGAARKAGSALTYAMDKCLLPRKGFTRIREKGGVELEPISTERYHRLYTEWAEPRGLVHFIRTLPYLRWRVEENPIRAVTPYLLLDHGESLGYVVVDEVTENGVSQLTVDDYTPRVLNDRLPEVMACLCELHPGTDVVEVNAVHGGLHESAAAGLGFTVEPWLTVIMMAFNNTVQEGGELYRGKTRLSDVQRWHLTASDIY